MNMEETWFDGGYNSNKNIAFAHVEMGLMSHYHIDKDWRENVKYEHKFNGKTYFYSLNGRLIISIEKIGKIQNIRKMLLLNI